MKFSLSWLKQYLATDASVERIADMRAIDRHGAAAAADALAWQSRDVLEQRHAAADVAARDDEIGKRLFRHHGDEIAELQIMRGGEIVEADRRAGGRIPDQLDRHGHAGRDAEGDQRGIGRHDIAEAGHPSTLRRFSHA